MAKTFTEEIKLESRRLGFDKVGVAPADALTEEGELLRLWLARGFHGRMSYMARDPQRRADPRLLLPSAKSVVSVALNYFRPEKHTDAPEAGKISRYAWGDDYHDVLRDKLESLLEWVREREPGVEGKICVDSSPMMDKAWAVRAGLGWIGKHTNLITKEFGSWVFLGELLLSIELDYDSFVEPDHCGACRACIDACPTRAIIAPYQLDATRCISYGTIELRETELPEPIRSNLEGWVFGCDICQDVCPWSRFSKETAEERFEPREGVVEPRLREMVEMSQEEFSTRFRRSAIKRAKLAGLKRNALAVTRDRREGETEGLRDGATGRRRDWRPISTMSPIDPISLISPLSERENVMSIYDPNEIARECVSCKRCYPSNLQFCRDCLVELRDIETIPYMIDGRYRLERVINHGGSGIVFVATNEAGQEVAIKIIRASAIAEPREQDRFRLEAQIALNLKHPQIAAVLDFGMLPNAYAYIVSEYVGGDSLRDEIKRRGKFDVDDAIQVIAETCEALDAAHKAGLVHRDLRPECIIVTPSFDRLRPNVKIVNFSLSKYASRRRFVPGTTAKLQGRGQLPLRPTYLSPEQFRGEEADLRSDIYSLGVIAYEMLAGRPPFTAKRVGDFGVKLLNSRPPSLRALNPDVNIVIEAEIFRALEKDPMDRQQRALEFRRDLLNALSLN